ncbi:MAG: hypothetical protein QOJ46_232 [bacterium]
MSSIAQATLRANPEYELVLLDRLSAAERALLEAGEECYGVLRPRSGTDLPLRTASPDTALLFLTLGEPAGLPSYLRGHPGGHTDRALARLVVDGVLEIEHEGAFSSGAQAAEIVLRGRSTGGRGRIGELSAAALRYGQVLAMHGLPEDALALRLYCYGRRPVSEAGAHRLGEVASLYALLGIDAGGAARPALDSGWRPTPLKPGRENYWRSWQARRAPAARRRDDAGYKLYVSPDVDALNTAFAAVAGSLATARGVTAFKVGSDAHGLCRPDKLVVYFDRLDDLQAGAATLRAELDGCPAHGIPFTAAVTADGLLSWGADPPALDDDATSWRLWVSQRLAEYLVLGDATRADSGHGAQHAVGVAVDRASSDVEPWQFALERLRLAGIDTDTWIPASGMWEEALASA